MPGRLLTGPKTWRSTYPTGVVGCGQSLMRATPVSISILVTCNPCVPPHRVSIFQTEVTPPRSWSSRLNEGGAASLKSRIPRSGQGTPLCRPSSPMAAARQLTLQSTLLRTGSGFVLFAERRERWRLPICLPNLWESSILGSLTILGPSRLFFFRMPAQINLRFRRGLLS